MPTSVPAPRSSAAPELRRHLLQLVIGVVVLDVIALTLYRVLGVDGWPGGRQRGFTVAWVALTVAVVMLPLQRIRAARVRARRARAALR